MNDQTIVCRECGGANEPSCPGCHGDSNFQVSWEGLPAHPLYCYTFAAYDYSDIHCRRQPERDEQSTAQNLRRAALAVRRRLGYDRIRVAPDGVTLYDVRAQTAYKCQSYTLA